jgi:hypothetical protein
MHVLGFEQAAECALMLEIDDELAVPTCFALRSRSRVCRSRETALSHTERVPHSLAVQAEVARPNVGSVPGDWSDTRNNVQHVNLFSPPLR